VKRPPTDTRVKYITWAKERAEAAKTPWPASLNRRLARLP
jgi:hypothetical protein